MIQWRKMIKSVIKVIYNLHKSNKIHLVWVSNKDTGLIRETLDKSQTMI